MIEPALHDTIISKNYHYFFASLLGIISLLCDQVSKHLVISAHLPKIICNNMNIIYVSNDGIVWGLAQEYGIYLACTGAVSLTFILIRSAMWKKQPYISSILLAGCLGNLIDRYQHGSVIDWIDWHACGYHWPAFNLADTYLLVGAFLLLVHSFFKTTDA